MNTKHIFVSLIDINELLPFSASQKKNLQESLKEQERSRKELNKFIHLLEKNFKENIYYLGMDIIGEKSYERFMFKKSGFLEVMVENPIALNAHFIDSKRAGLFAKSLKYTLNKIIPKSVKSIQKQMLLDSIEVNDQNDNSLTVNDWNKIKDIRL